MRSPLRVAALVRKELVEVLRQPRLLLILVLGPFLILLLFGLGYKETAEPRRAVFVVPDDPEVARRVEEHALSLGPILDYRGSTTDEEAARERLRRGEVDMVVIVPEDMQGPARGQSQGELVLVHNEINPLQVGYLERLAQTYADSVNRQVLMRAAQRGQEDAAEAQDDVRRARDSAAALRAALEAGDQAGAQRHGEQVDRDMSALELALGATANFFSEGQLQGAGGRAASGGDAEEARRLEEDLTALDQRLEQFRQGRPEVVVQPFVGVAHSLRDWSPKLADYFAPSVIVVLLQHLAVTVAALSIVRERRLGVMEMFRVSPLGAFELLLGKYFSFLIFAAVVALALTGLVTWGLGVPILGSWTLYGLSVLALVFASVGLGILISLLSETDSQAVQYTMIVLLVSVFFSGFLVILSAIVMPIRLVSWLVPATYGIALLQDVMLRGAFPRPELLLVLAAAGLGLFVLDWRLLQREMRVGR